ncbi:MAG: flavodoxin [Acetobacter malorum]
MGQIRMSGFSRRALIATSILISVMRGKCANARSKSLPFRSDTKILVAYFTRSGNTKVIAGTLHRNVGGEIFEIRPARPYPEDYEQTVAQAKQERDSGYEPPLAATVPDFDTYDTVFLGFPIWGETAPPVIRSFLHTHDWKGKILRPFITHGGYGVGNSPSVLASHAVGATIEAPFVMEADQERRTLNEVRGWLNEIRHG